MSDARPFRHIAFLGTVTECLPDGGFRSLAEQLSGATQAGPPPSLVVALASELMGRDRLELPSWVDTDTRYLVVLDVPEQAVLRLASRLRLHKPDQRLQVCRDPSVVTRLVIALKRPAPWEGILDAYVLKDSLVVVLGDMSVRKFPVGRLPKVRRFEPAAVSRFVIDSAGSYLHWPDRDVHMGPSQMLQAVDPMYLADVEMRRYQMENVSQALHDMRNDRRLKQTEILGLSERHVRRLEREEMRLTADAANKFASALDLTLSEFADELSERITAMKKTVLDPRLFITGPRHLCPRCGQVELGTLSVMNNVHTRRCGGCFHDQAEPLPSLAKKMIYLDQMVLSDIAKKLDPVWREEKPHADEFWLEAFDRIDRLVKLQLIVCPNSPIHEVESSYAERYEPVLRRLYEHLASGVSLRFPHEVFLKQLSEAFEAWSAERDPDWSRIAREEVIRGDLDRWSDRLRITVNLGRLPGEIASSRHSRARAHEGFRQRWKEWASEGSVSFEDHFQNERRGVAVAALGPHRKPLWLAQLMKWLVSGLAEHGVPEETRLPEAKRFLYSEAALSAPENHLGALLFAGLARRAASGQKRVPSRGTLNDLKFISAYLPYCDAMFIDNEFAQLLREEPLASAITDYSTKIFSARSRDDFMDYLGDLEKKAASAHVDLVTRTYGETWLEPYRSVLEHERGR
ncbi:hypothetical protein [Candidatus Palauibacter sp.]|uniref:hypothetical protein n=1 Tax=Candidatus Palauibacter sp. TaxID=3101350 RepID=UPI003B52188D